MRNRSIPFGYYYQNGVLAVHPQEGQTVQAVFMAYLSGEPLSKIAAHLTAKLVEYLPGRWQWDKARVKRILDNDKYIGAGNFPQLISEKQFQMAHQKKESASTNRQPVDEDIKLFKGLTYCHHCGCLMVRRMDSRMEHPVTWRCAQCSYFLSLPDEEFKQRVFLLQKKLADNPLLAEKEEDEIPVTSMEARRLTNEIYRMSQNEVAPPPLGGGAGITHLSWIGQVGFVRSKLDHAGPTGPTLFLAGIVSLSRLKNRTQGHTGPSLALTFFSWCVSFAADQQTVVPGGS